MRIIAYCLCILVLSLFSAGCQSTSDGGKGLSVNMKHSIIRSAGDTAMTAMLDEGIDPIKARTYVVSIHSFVSSGDINKDALRVFAYEMAGKVDIPNINGYVEALMAVIPGSVDEYTIIPVEYRDLVVSFLRDGAQRALDLYRN